MCIGRFVNKLKANGRLLLSSFFVYLVLAFSSCKNDVGTSSLASQDLSVIRENVLSHFEGKSDTLKYESAYFLIENMPYHFTHGNLDAEYDSLYINTVKEPIHLRYTYLKKRLNDIAKNSAIDVFDAANINADSLIMMIDRACDNWEKTQWSKCYDKSIFFDYVLPYRLNTEPLSNWYGAIDKEFPLLNAPFVLSRRGRQYEAENAFLSSCNSIEAEGTSANKAVLMCNNQAAISFCLESERATKKRLIIKYSATARGTHAFLKVNEIFVDTLQLVPTKNLKTFGEKWFNFSLPLKPGSNTITIYNASDTLVVDYIQLGAIERFDHNKLIDFTTNCYQFMNKQTKNYITFDTLQDQIELRPFVEGNHNQLFRLNYQGYPLWKIGTYHNEKQDCCLEMKFGTFGTLSPDSFVTKGIYENRPFQQWVFFPLGKNCYRIMNKHTGMFLESRKNVKRKKEMLVQNPYSNRDSQVWILHQGEKNESTKPFYQIGSAISEALKIFDITHQFDFFTYPNEFHCKGSTLIKEKAGNCVDEANYTVYLCRYLGIPSAIDFTPHWGNRSNGHAWSVILDTNGKAIPFYMGNVPGDTVHYFHPYKKPKVFRTRFQLNKEFSTDLKYEESVPNLFANPTFTDVTDEYCKTTDVIRSIPSQYGSNRIAYICVFDNRNWVPVSYGKIREGKVKFVSMGRNIMYMMALFKNGEMNPIGNPFLIEENGLIREVILDEGKKQTLKLSRKYPFMGEQDYFNFRMSGGMFQGSNTQDFSHADVLYTHHGITNGNWYDISLKGAKKYKYLRYVGPKGSFCNINELEFFNEKGTKVTGKIVGTDGEPWGKKEKVFDGNILTGFGANSPDGNWVGLELSQAHSIARIRYIGRNDGNCIEIGDEYILYVWKNGQWEELGHKVATKNDLLFQNVPVGGLFVLNDITKGSEERIFTYENGKQIWW